MRRALVTARLEEGRRGAVVQVVVAEIEVADAVPVLDDLGERVPALGGERRPGPDSFQLVDVWA